MVQQIHMINLITTKAQQNRPSAPKQHHLKASTIQKPTDAAIIAVT
jgi:hypothetical protein